ncbi:MAG: ABC transporter ATP-binding protein [Clostridiales Family XIII bacterium]|jgi:oligopeptide/dipeptide ABC transporter ATP-binding protein|nr:ABC transporter ATP-binding protein [Clostridiales Family XIII bacterium]
MDELLRVENLHTVFRTDRGVVHAVRDISYEINESEIIGLVGESGCGKSISQMSVLQLIPTPPGKIVSGKALFDGVDLLKLGKHSDELSGIRGEKISMIFQEPMTSLNPAMTIAKQMSEVLIVHLNTQKREARERCVDMLAQVGIPDPGNRIDDYPHQLSGGMRQRVMVGMAMLCNPKLIIADEATTALDATIQAQLLELMYEMVRRYKTALVLVTHNLGVVARYAQRINVMYAGRIVESGTVREIWNETAHPYTKGLLKCMPKLGTALTPIHGKPPSLIGESVLCPFRPRCEERIALCDELPVGAPTHLGGSHSTACIRVTEGKGL